MASLRGGYAPDVHERLTADADQILARYPEPRSALLPLLHLVQSEDGYVSPAGIAFCSDVLGLSRASVSAVATFYSQYKRRPNGEYTVGVCTNTLCAVMGGDLIFDRLSEHLGVGNDETTPDGRITLERVECNAACDFAPVVMINWEFFDNQTPASITETVDAILAGEPVRPTRGADSVATFKEVSRVLAGFEDGRAGEGPAAGAPTLAGLNLAREQGWHAPEYESRGGPVSREDDGGGAPAEPEREPTVGTEGSSSDRKPVSEGDVRPEGPGGAGPAGSSVEEQADPDPESADPGDLDPPEPNQQKGEGR